MGCCEGGRQDATPERVRTRELTQEQSSTRLLYQSSTHFARPKLIQVHETVYAFKADAAAKQNSRTGTQ